MSQESERLFLEKGYARTSMREIAAACGIAVGNLNYHFPRKEDVMMVQHNQLMHAFEKTIVRELPGETGWRCYFATEYSFLYYIVTDGSTKRLYDEVINVPALRNAYYERHHDLFVKFVPEYGKGAQDQDAFLSTVAMCALEFQILEKYERFRKRWNYDDLIRQIFSIRLMFLHLEPADYSSEIEEGIRIGKSLEGSYRIGSGIDI